MILQKRILKQRKIVNKNDREEILTGDFFAEDEFPYVTENIAKKAPTNTNLILNFRNRWKELYFCKSFITLKIRPEGLVRQRKFQMLFEVSVCSAGGAKITNKIWKIFCFFCYCFFFYFLISLSKWRDIFFINKKYSIWTLYSNLLFFFLIKINGILIFKMEYIFTFNWIFNILTTHT